MNSRYDFKQKALVIVLIQLMIGIFHFFRIGTCLSGRWYRWYCSYFSDLVIPFGLYFLLILGVERTCIDLRKLCLKPVHKALIVFGFTTTIEILQAVKVDIVGITFDPLDILMYATGCSLALLTETKLFYKIFPFWKINEK